MASRDDDKVMAGLLRRTLARSSNANAAIGGDDCPPSDVLAAYYERSLGDDESAQYELHFSQCARCREQLAAMVRAEEAPQPKATWAWLWSPYFLAPALAMLALAVFFGAHRSSQTATINQQSNAPLVAMSQPSQPPAQETPLQPEAPNEAARSVPSDRERSAPSDSVERGSLTKTKQAPLPMPQSASESVTVTPTPATPPTASLDAIASAPLPSAPLGKKVQDLPLNGRSVAQLQPVAPNANTSSANATQDNVVGVPRATTQSVEVTAAAPPQAQTEQSAAPVVRALAPAPAPTASAGAGAGAGRGAGVLGGVVTGTAAGTNTTAEAVNRSQTQAPAAMSRYAAAAKSPAAQVVDKISTDKTFQTPNTNVLWRPADAGFVERSPDGGATWEGQMLPGLSGEIDAGSSPKPKICWLVGSGGSIFVTKDAMNWNKIAPPVPADFSAVTAKDASNATITAADGRQFQTTDGGKRWKALP
jgi:hypothetical protein